MELSSNLESLAKWLSETYEFKADKVLNLGWRVPTLGLYRRYLDWQKHPSRLKAKPATIEEIWGIIQILYPFVTIVGRRGDRAYTGVIDWKIPESNKIVENLKNSRRRNV